MSEARGIAEGSPGKASRRSMRGIISESVDPAVGCSAIGADSRRMTGCSNGFFFFGA